MSSKKYGKCDLFSMNSSQERIRIRFQNLKTRLQNVSIDSSIIISENNLFAEINNDYEKINEKNCLENSIIFDEFLNGKTSESNLQNIYSSQTQFSPLEDTLISISSPDKRTVKKAKVIIDKKEDFYIKALDQELKKCYSPEYQFFYNFPANKRILNTIEFSDNSVNETIVSNPDLLESILDADSCKLQSDIETQYELNSNCDKNIEKAFQTDFLLDKKEFDTIIPGEVGTEDIEASVNITKLLHGLNDSVCVQAIDGNFDELREIKSEELEEYLKLKTISFKSMPTNPKKIAEASFSEVFLINKSVFKIIPLNEWYSKTSFMKEAGVLKAIYNETGVCKMKECFLIKGKYTNEYIKAWEGYLNGENEHPSKYNDDQEYGCLVLNNCGQDLEAYSFSKPKELFNFLYKLIEALMLLEEKYKFEHRDLHWGNVMIKSKDIFVIDFTLSRLEISLSELGLRTKNSNDEKVIIYKDLNEESWLFNGDSSFDFQFDVYRQMKRANKGNWKEYNPKSNLKWIKYIVHKLMIKADKMENNQKAAVKHRLKTIMSKTGICNNIQELFKWFEDRIEEFKKK